MPSEDELFLDCCDACVDDVRVPVWKLFLLWFLL